MGGELLGRRCRATNKVLVVLLALLIRQLIIMFLQIAEFRRGEFMSSTLSGKERILIVGGVAGGASAAARARRLSETAEIVLFERGEYVSFANCGLPYFISGAITERSKLLVQTPESLYARFRIDVRINTEVLSIDADAKTVEAKNLKTGEVKLESYTKLILSPGAAPFVPPTPGVNSKRVLTLRDIPNMDAIIEKINTGKTNSAVVIGGGFIGLEMVEALRELNIKTSLVELAPQVMPPVDQEIAEMLHDECERNGVKLHLGTSVEKFTETDEGLTVQLSNGEAVECDFALMAIGVKPETHLAESAGIKVGERGGFEVDSFMRSCDPDIFAVGDAVQVTDFVTGSPALYPLAGPANRQGRIAASNILGKATEYAKTQGTGICKIFDLSVAMTGANEKTLKRLELDYEKVYVHAANHAGYYPGATPITLKLLFEPETGVVLGAQGVGAQDVDKRIDVLATAIRAGMSVFDLEELELCYAPPFGSAKDPVNLLGFVASNVLRGDVKLCHTEDMLSPSENQFLLDVRTKMEYSLGTIPGCVNIPVDELRDRLDELPRDKEILVTCRVGLRGYLACRILTLNGFNCRNLTGGYITFEYAARSRN